MPPESISVLLVDDHAVVRAGYKRFLELDRNIRVLGEADSSEAAYTFLQHHQVDMVVMDLTMPGFGGLEGLRRIVRRFSAQRVLVFSMHENPAVVSQALASGACGYLTKSTPPERIISAIHEAMGGGRPLSDDVAGAVAAKDGQLNNPPHFYFAPREFEIFRMLALGAEVEEISTRLHLSLKTVANYQTGIRRKLDVRNAIGVHEYAKHHDLI